MSICTLDLVNTITEQIQIITVPRPLPIDETLGPVTVSSGDLWSQSIGFIQPASPVVGCSSLRLQVYFSSRQPIGPWPMCCI